MAEPESPAAGEPEPNAAQRRLIEHADGLCLVDAGAGTGKTFAVARRYAAIVDRPGVEPADVLLATFTRSGATEMRERIVDRSDYDLRAFADAPIGTFHSLCGDLLREHGYDAPTHLGIDDRVTRSTRVLEDDVLAADLFAEFLGRFRDAHPEHADRFRELGDPRELSGLIERLAAKGVFPTADGWYGDGAAHLAGDFEAFRQRFAERNRPRNDGRKQSPLRADLRRYGDGKTYLPDAPTRADLRGDRGTKRVDPSVARRVFDADRSDLVGFVHDVYFEYLAFALERDVLSFGFLQGLAYVALREDDALRERAAFEYVMVDEFQDTSEIQFKLALLLSATDNLCVVGDWKQSIYGFQYADVANVTDFEARLAAYRDALNDDADRVAIDDVDVERIELSENYRSTAPILGFAEETLVAPATSDESVDEGVLDDVVSLSANAPFEATRIEALAHEDEHEAVLAAIQRVVGNDDYPVADEDGNPRAPDYGDVAVLTRTRDYGRELLAVARDYGLPVAYDGGVELFRTDAAKLLLAWLRILEGDADRGWAVVLERAGYALDEVESLLDAGDYPDDLVAFRAALAEAEAVGSVARRVFERYGFDGDEADVILHTVRSVHDGATTTRGDLIAYVERAIERGTTHEVHAGTGEDAVTVGTIHAAKGREYPIVILANMNDGRFPPSTRDASVIRYDEAAGLWSRKRYAESGEHPHVYDDWRHDVVRHCLPDDHDEERRLLYVAVTRAEHHLLLAAGDQPNAFLEGLPVDVDRVEPSVEAVDRGETTQTQLPFSISPPDGPTGETPHSLMDESVFEAAGEAMESVDGRGTDFGSRVHEFAEAYARDEGVTPAGDDEHHVAALLDGCDGEVYVEEPARLPLDVDGERVTVAGVVDLVHVTDDRVEVVDYKTDRSRHAESEYRTQLGVYYHVLDAVYPDRTVTADLFYTHEGERVRVDPPSVDELRDVVRER